LSPRTPGPGFEPKDINSGALVSLIGAFLILLGVSALVTRGVHHLLMKYAPVHNQVLSPLADLHRLPPEPRLQVNPATDLIRMRDVENVTLNNYAWIDEEAGTARIPIARAMAILAERGLPKRKEGR
jgi:hypothetical protein